MCTPYSRCKKEQQPLLLQAQFIRDVKVQISWQKLLAWPTGFAILPNIEHIKKPYATYNMAFILVIILFRLWGYQTRLFSLAYSRNYLLSNLYQVQGGKSIKGFNYIPSFPFNHNDLGAVIIGIEIANIFGRIIKNHNPIV